MSYDSDDEDDHVEPYDWSNPTVEPRPNSVVFLPIFQELATASRKPIYMLRDTLAASPYQNKVTRSLLEEVQHRIRDDLTEPTMFAVAGDMAAGKSSFINSVLSVGVIARKGNSGDSCTWVVQKFRKQFDDQESPYEARVTFFRPEEIRKIVTSLFEKYYRATNLDKQDGDAVDGEDVKSENFNDTSTVLDAFMDLFSDQTEFQTEQDARNFLCQANSEDDRSILDQLVNWAQQLHDDYTDGGETIKVGASDIDRLSKDLQRYTHQLPGERGRSVCLWPLVSVIEFGLAHSLLQEEIVLVDAPGLSDSNGVRANNARKHIRQCTHQITVADISRAKNDKSLREELAQSYAFRGSAGTMAVLTRGDGIDTTTEVAGSPLEKKYEQQLFDECKVLREKRTELTKKKRKPTVSRDEKYEMDQQIREIDREHDGKEAKWEACRIKMRNRSVIEALQQQYRSLTGDPKPLNAFVAGNEVYGIHQVGYTSRNAPKLSVQETGIPAIRNKIISLPAEGKFNEAMHLAEAQIPNLISFFELYCSKTHLARRAEIEGILMQPLNLLPGLLNACKNALMEKVKLRIIGPMESDEAVWVSEARKLCRGWARDFAKTHLPIMKKEGFKKGSRKNPDVDWNLALLEIPEIKQNMDDCFRDFMNDISPAFRDLEGNIGKLLDSTKVKIRGDQKLKVMGVESFLDTFKHERPTIIRCIEEQIRNARRSATVVCQDATVNSPTCYLQMAMKPIYTECISIKGRGAPAQRMELFEKRVATMSGVWLEVRDFVERNFEEYFTAHLQMVGKTVEGIFASIRKKFEMLCDDTIVKDEEEKLLEEALRQRLSEQLVHAKELLGGEVKEAVMKCMNYGKGDQVPPPPEGRG